MGDRDTFGDELRWLRKKADISQVEMASALGVRQSTYSRWESGEAEPRASDLRRIIEVLEIPAAAFFRFLQTDTESANASEDLERKGT